METTKLQQHAIVQGEKRYKVWYSVYEDYATINGDNYGEFRGMNFTGVLSGLCYIDNSDSMIDYFERPYIKVPNTHPLYEKIKAIDEKKRIRDAQAREKKMHKRQTAIESVEKKLKVYGVWYEIVSQAPHPRRENWTYYTLKKISNRAQKLYGYAKSNDGKWRTKIWSVGTL